MAFDQGRRNVTFAIFHIASLGSDLFPVICLDGFSKFRLLSVIHFVAMTVKNNDE